MEMELCYILEEANYLELSNQFFYVRVFNAAVVLNTELELRYLEKPSTWKCLRNISGPRNYSAAVVSIQGTGIPLQPRRSQVPGGVQPVLLEQGFKAALVLYTKLELHCSLEENCTWKCLTSFPGTGFTVQLLFLYRELELHHSLEKAKYLELSNQFFCDRVYNAAFVL
jgi:hypothetical protein